MTCVHSFLLTFVGIPACGKSSLARELIQYITQTDGFTWLDRLVEKDSNGFKQIDKTSVSNINIYHIEFDLIFQRVFQLYNSHTTSSGGNNSNETINRLWKLTRQEIFNQVYNISNSTKEKELILDTISSVYSVNNNSNINNVGNTINIFILDDNMHFKSMRYKYYQLSLQSCQSNSNSIRYCQLYFSKDLQLSIENNSTRVNNQFIPIDTIENMYNQIELPTPINSGSWEKYTCHINTFNKSINEINNINKVWYSIIDKWNEFLLESSEMMKNNIILDQKKIQDKINVQNNKVHQLDLQIRKIIGEIIKQHNESHGSSCNHSQTPNISKLLSNLKQHYVKIIIPQMLHDYYHQQHHTDNYDDDDDGEEGREGDFITNIILVKFKNHSKHFLSNASENE